jgi:hypothetical protein
VTEQVFTVEVLEHAPSASKMIAAAAARTSAMRGAAVSRSFGCALTWWFLWLKSLC